MPVLVPGRCHDLFYFHSLPLQISVKSVPFFSHLHLNSIEWPHVIDKHLQMDMCIPLH